jgi:ligand-binding sensor domain-containing protein
MHAQPSGLRFQRLSVEQGLSQSTVSAILRDSQGFMWFGTADGESPDGYAFTATGTTRDSSSPTTVCQKTQKEPWIGTQAGG